MVELDSAFIQAVEHRPKPRSIEAQNIPLIDLSPLNSAPDSASLAAEIGGACRDWGFFQVINHGVPPECGERVESAARKFFALPETEKMKVRRDAENPFGYYDGEHTKNVRDWKEVFDFAVENPIIFPVWNERGDLELRKLFNQWPHNFPELREACEEHTAEMENLAFKLLELVASSLGLPKDRFNAFFKDQTTRVRLNHYPPCPAPDLALGLGRHKDTGVLTILTQDDVPGLEVKRKTDGEWILVKPTPRAYIINVGDILQVWSNDEYESVEHRVVVNADKERFSIPYFLYPAHYTFVEPLGEMISEEKPAKFKGYNWGEFRATRNRELKRSLYALFSQYGRILDIVALKTPKLRGQAWVVFSEVTAASNAVRQMQNFQFYEKPLRIQYAKSKSDCIAKAEGTYDKKKKQEEKAERKKRAEEGQPAAPSSGPRADSNGVPSAASRQTKPSAQEAAADPNNILFIQNLPYETNSMMLELLFKQYPGFREVRMVDAKPGIAFVEFEDDSQSSVAMQDLQGFKINPQNAMVITYAKK